MILCDLNHFIYAVPQLQPVLVNNHCSGLVTGQSPVLTQQKGERVRYVIDRMTMSDVPRVIEIERLAYPSTWPPSAYRKELQDNRWAHYIVLRDKQILEERTVEAQDPEKPLPRKSRLFPLSLLPNRPAIMISPPELASIIGFAGLWLMVDEAHVTTIAMHPENRRRGLGEFLLVSLIDIAYTIGARWVTLEVRVSNHTAQNLYRKYGFHEAGMRHRYYSDNQEDALIMWTDEINSPEYKQKYGMLKSALLQKLETQ
jgi:ribosomal-protein-alanine N-acetyltransferase